MGRALDSWVTNVYRLASGLQGYPTKKALLRKVDQIWEETIECFLSECLKIRDTQKEAIIWKCEQEPKGIEKKS